MLLSRAHRIAAYSACMFLMFRCRACSSPPTCVSCVFLNNTCSKGVCMCSATSMLLLETLLTAASQNPLRKRNCQLLYRHWQCPSCPDTHLYGTCGDCSSTVPGSTCAAPEEAPCACGKPQVARAVLQSTCAHHMEDSAWDCSTHLGSTTVFCLGLYPLLPCVCIPY